MKNVYLSSTLKARFSEDVHYGFTPDFELIHISLRGVGFAPGLGSEVWGPFAFGDEILFLKSSGELVNIFLEAPDPDFSRNVSWDQLPIVTQSTGTLVLTHPDDSSVELAETVRYWDTSGKSLAMLEKQALEQPLHAHWLTDYFAFLFVDDGRYCGWIMKNPLRFAPDPEPEKLLEPCNEFYDLATLESIDKLEKGDLKIRQRLLDLRTFLDQSGHDLDKKGVREQIMLLVCNMLSFVGIK